MRLLSFWGIIFPCFLLFLMLLFWNLFMCCGLVGGEVESPVSLPSTYFLCSGSLVVI
jgi:hypothetical protein